jgi:pimeloyl-ACP methyl ester carboxylesterase
MGSEIVDIGGPVHVLDHGGTGPPILLVHGLGGSHVNWMCVAEPLTRHGRVRAIDLVGFGHTPPEGRSAAVLDQRNLLITYLEEHLREPAVLIGNSMGGFLSLIVAAKRPDLVRGVVTVGSAYPRGFVAPPDIPVSALFAVHLVPGLGERILRWRHERLGPEGVAKQTLRLCTVDPHRIAEDAYRAHLEMARVRAEHPWTRAAFLEATRSLIPLLMRGRRVADIVRSIDAPGLIVQGEHDRLVPLRAARRLAEVRSDWDLALLPDVGHVPQLEAPEEFLAVVTPWLEALGAGDVAA